MNLAYIQEVMDKLNSLLDEPFLDCSYNDLTLRRWYNNQGSVFFFHWPDDLIAQLHILGYHENVVRYNTTERVAAELAREMAWEVHRGIQHRLSAGLGD